MLQTIHYAPKKSTKIKYNESELNYHRQVLLDVLRQASLTKLTQLMHKRLKLQVHFQNHLQQHQLEFLLLFSSQVYPSNH